MTKSLKSLVLLLSVCVFSYAQTDGAAAIETSSTTNETSSTGFIFKPTIGLGTSFFSFYGYIFKIFY